MAEAQAEKRLLRPEEVARTLGVGRTRVFRWIATGEIRSLKVGGSRRVEPVEVDRFVERLRAEQSGSAQVA